MNRFSRRAFVALGVCAALPLRVFAQPAGRIHRLGWIGTLDSSKEPYAVAFVQRLRELGFVQGANLDIAFRHAAGRVERLPAVAAELVALKCDAFFASGPEAPLVALKNASRDTPIVFVAVDFDPVATRHVVNPARPEGRLTGVTAIQSELPAKRLELVKELLPAARRVAVMSNDQTPGQLSVVEEAAKRLGLALHVIHFKQPPFDYEGAIAGAVKANAEVLFVLGSAFFIPARRPGSIQASAMRPTAGPRTTPGRWLPRPASN